jgi:hypothetical protein
MSAERENFLARWSRRKEAVEAEEAAALPALGPQGRAEAGSDTDSGPGSPAPGSFPASPCQQAEAEEPEPLPRIEDLTAESDLSAFLRKGVPEALKAAALRRAWSLDPAIRDYIGLAEYQWDYNNPASIPGFGPASGGMSVKNLFSRPIGMQPDRPREDAFSDAQGAAESGAPDAHKESRQTAESAADPQEASAQDASTPAASTEGTVPPVAAPTEVAGSISENAPPRASAAPRHGRAAPR